MADDGNDQGNLLADKLMTKRTVVLSGDITRKNVEHVGQRIIELQTRSNDRINLIIDSGGGSIDAAFDICDPMSVVITAPIRGIALGLCGSAATYIMLHCTERIGAPNSRFIVHSGSVHPSKIGIDEHLEKNLEQLAKSARATEERVLQMYTKRLTPKIWGEKNLDDAERRSFVKKLIERGDQQFDYQLQAPEAIDVGLIQKIATEKIDIFSVQNEQRT